MGKILFDLDGTLIDSRQRLYRLFIHLTKTEITFSTYWTFKRQGISNETILSKNFNWSPNQIKLFVSAWMELIETQEFLRFDMIFPKTKEILTYLQKKGNNNYLITNRQNRTKTLEQLHNLEFFHLFKTIYVTEQKISKKQLLKLNLSFKNTDLFIGDTGEDIKTGKDLGLVTIGVLTGFRNYRYLSSYKPDHILSGIHEIESIII